MNSKTESRVKQDMLNGMTPTELSKKYSVSKSAIYRLKKKIVTIQPVKSEISARPDNPIVRSDAIRFVRKHKRGFTVDQLANKLNMTCKNALAVIQQLSHHDGYNLIHRNNTWSLEVDVAPIAPLKLKTLLGKKYSFGVISDNHLCNKAQRLDVLEAAYDMYKKRGIKNVFNAGNIIDGEFKFNKYELLAYGVHDQCMYVADHYPQRSGITTHFITGDCHEGWYQSREGLKIGWYIQKMCEENGRKDMKFIGHIEQDIILKRQLDETRIRIMHPGGGTPYALSYPSQKMVESFQGGDKPNILIMGHFHKFNHNFSREVVCVMPGCTEDQTAFMRKKKLAAHVGFCIMTLHARIDGTIGSCSVEFFPFYDRGYHNKLNSYELL